MTIKLIILCVEDEPDVLDAITRDLGPFDTVFQVEGTSSAKEAEDWIKCLDPDQQRVALIYCDHVMPGKRGVDFLIDLVNGGSAAVKKSRKVLFTGQAGHEDTIEAINNAHIEHYLAKPWERGELEKLTRKLMTDYVLESDLSPLPYMSMLDQERVVHALHQHSTIQDV